MVCMFIGIARWVMYCAVSRQEVIDTSGVSAYIRYSKGGCRLPLMREGPHAMRRGIEVFFV